VRYDNANGLGEVMNKPEELITLKLTKTKCHALTQMLKKDCHIELRNYIYRMMHKGEG